MDFLYELTTTNETRIMIGKMLILVWGFGTAIGGFIVVKPWQDWKRS